MYTMHHSVILCEVRMDIVKKVVAEAVPDVVPEPIVNLIETLKSRMPKPTCESSTFIHRSKMLRIFQSSQEATGQA